MAGPARGVPWSSAVRIVSVSMEGAPRKAGTCYRCDVRHGTVGAVGSDDVLGVDRPVPGGGLDGTPDGSGRRGVGGRGQQADPEVPGDVRVGDGGLGRRRLVRQHHTDHDRSDDHHRTRRSRTRPYGGSGVAGELDGTPTPGLRTDADVYAMVDSLGDVGAALNGGDTGRLAAHYTALGLRIRYEHASTTADLVIEPVMRVNSACVRGGTPALTPYLNLQAA